MKRKKTFLIIIYILMLFSVFKPGNVWAVGKVEVIEDAPLSVDCTYMNNPGSGGDGQSEGYMYVEAPFNGDYNKNTVSLVGITVKTWKGSSVNATANEKIYDNLLTSTNPKNTYVNPSVSHALISFTKQVSTFESIVRHHYNKGAGGMGGKTREYKPADVCPSNAVVLLNKDGSYDVNFFDNESDANDFQQWFKASDKERIKADADFVIFPCDWIDTSNVKDVYGIYLNTEKTLESYTGYASDKAAETLTQLKKQREKFNNNYDKPITCSDIIGTTDDESNIAWLLQKILNYIKVLGTLLVIVLSGLDFTQAIMASNPDTMKKAQTKLMIRVGIVIGLFLLPSIIQLIIGLFFGNGITDITCGLK